MQVLFVLQQRALERRDQLARIAGFECFGLNILGNQQLNPV